MSGPLSNVRVLDLSRVLAGPWAAQNLGDLGAEVIKVERPGSGDDTRGYGPPFIQDAAGKDTSDAVYFTCTNRNKKSVTIDISSPAGQDLIRALAADSDVLIENYKVGTLDRYGLGYEALSKIRPGLVYCSVTGFGQDGPDAALPGYDILFQGQGGLMSITGEADDMPGGGPQKVGIAITDILSGMYAALAITAALKHRDSTGVGQYIDISLLDTMVAFTSGQAASWLHAGTIPKRWGTAHPQIAPYQVFATSDGHVILAVGNDSQFANFCSVAGRPELAEDSRYRLNADRVRNREGLIQLVAQIMRQRSKRQWLQQLKAGGVPCGPVNNMAEVFEEPQVIHRGLCVDMPHPLAGTVHTLANPMRFSRTKVEYRLAPPLLGEHTEEIMRDRLHLDADRIAELRKSGAI